MQDVLSRPDQSLPIEELDFHELSLEDSSDPLNPFIVRRTHYEWDEGKQQTLPADHIIDLLRTLEQAEARYAVLEIRHEEFESPSVISTIWVIPHRCLSWAE